ncbi:SCO2525 family SAM-dependent methyltransferase [Streptomyces sp. NK08204]|uniref:SCO2525 family SAM-dependent methyltransferase n=1 Tax=Streptomyces sp. NK08204 TaxID=2873260 RepID=UPI001CECCC55|nr:SCO2525 family SAM-dependent methyltransferase [Streptomyces sp. NK08204]
MTSGSPIGTEKLNDDVAWEDFDPGEYIKHNYLVLHPDDEAIIGIVRDHFSGHFGASGGVASGIDVGAGPNLYPALSMLPWCDKITLLERSPANVGYLNGQRDSYARQWGKFWDVLCRDEVYGRRCPDPRTSFAQKVRPRPGNLFDLCERDERWAMGTMFFVAESITTSLEEFRRGVSCFMSALEPEAPFAAAFMEHSRGYRVGESDFPALDIDEQEVRDTLGAYASKIEIHRLGKPGGLLREGYTGMIVACGHRGA